MAVTPEEARLLAYEAQRARMAARDRRRRASLAGNPAARRALDAKYEPLRKWLAEDGPRSGVKPQ